MSEKQYLNETIRLLHERSTCRSFEDKKIPEEVLQQILDAGIHAPTGGNLQPYSIIKVENAETSKRLGELCEQQDFIGTAPVNLIFCIDWHLLKRWAEIEYAPFTATISFRHFWISFQDTVIAAQNICIAADALGLGSVYIGSVLECLPQLREMFQLPKYVFPVVLLSIGYPKFRPKPKPKLGTETVVHNETYRKMSDDDVRAAFNRKYGNRSKLEITDERLETIRRVCTNVHGEDFANKCLTMIRDNGYVNIAQAYFCLHYIADEMPNRNEEFLKTVRDFGFDWFEKYEPGVK
ncbi:MAG: nitroreductase family protein [Candidatus Zixiibacteriota bacterium]